MSNVRIKLPGKNSPGKGKDVNPLKTDEDLVGLLGRLDGIKTYKRFQGWKQSFLDRLDRYLRTDGCDRAQKASDEFKANMEKMKTYADKCNSMIEKGDLSNDKVTVKGRNSLNEMCKNLDIATNDTEGVIPQTKTDEKKCGYSKFELGAALVRDNFSCYDNMLAVDQSVTTMSTKLKDVADRQQLDAFEYYTKKFKKFCDIMADLGLYEVMLACRKFAVPPGYDEPDMIEITVKASNGRNITLELDSSETIGNVKSAIADACGIPPDKQILKFQGKILDKDSHTLDGCGIEDKSVLTVEPPTVPITVNTTDGKKIKLNIDPTQPMSEIKKKLEHETGLSPDNQRLFMDGNELPSDMKKAEDYGIKVGSELDLEPKAISIKVETPEGKTIPLKVRPDNTVEEIKKQLEGPSGIPAPKQVLEYLSKALPNDDKTVRDLGIKEGDTLQLKSNKIPITIKTYDGRNIKALIDPDDSLGDIKKQLEGDTGLPASKIHLYMNDTPLDDDSTKPGDYGIKANSVLDLLRVIFFLDVDTGSIGKLPLDKIIGGQNTINEAAAKEPGRKEIIKQMENSLR